MKYAFAILSFVTLAAFQTQVQAQAETKNSLVVSEARIFAPLKGTNATAGYGMLKNENAKDVTIIIGKVDGFKVTELHETTEKDGKMKMSKVDEVVIKAKQSFEMKPGGHHIMLFDATREIKEGDTLPVQILVNGKKESYDFKVVPRVQKEEGHHHH
jgi:copper(I)-binding protein